MVKLPNGNYLDSGGEATEEEMGKLAMFAEDVKKIEIIPVTENDALSIFSCEDQESSIEQVVKYIKSKTDKKK